MRSFHTLVEFRRRSWTNVGQGAAYMGSPDQIGRIHAGDTILDAVGERDKVEAARPRVVGQDGVVETGQRRGDGHECGTQKKRAVRTGGRAATAMDAD